MESVFGNLRYNGVKGKVGKYMNINIVNPLFLNNYNAIKKTPNVLRNFSETLDAVTGIQGTSTLYDKLNSIYPGIKYHVLDTSKINQNIWERQDYPFEKFFEEEIDESILDWEPASQEPSMLSTNVQARLNAARGKFAIIIPPELEEKMDNQPELAQNIMDKISRIIAQQDSVPSSIDSFNITLDKEGNITHYRFSGGGGEIFYNDKGFFGVKKEDKDTEQQEQYMRFLNRRKLQQDKLEKERLVKRDEIYQERILENIMFQNKNGEII